MVCLLGDNHVLAFVNLSGFGVDHVSGVGEMFCFVVFLNFLNTHTHTKKKLEIQHSNFTVEVFHDILNGLYEFGS